MINNRRTATLLSVGIVLAALYFARVVFIPLALAILLAFLLGPLVTRLRHWHLGRVLSALIVVAFSFVVVAIAAGFMASQLADLAHKLPEYEQNMQQKLQTLRSSGGGVLNRVTKLVRNVTDELTPAPIGPSKIQPGEEKPVPVEIRRSSFNPLDTMRNVLGSVLDLILTAGIVVVFVIFMLIQKEDLRDRLLRLSGAGRVNMTTQALDEAGQRVSRYLLALTVVNLAYGLAAAIGLYFIGVPNPLLWGIMASLLRFIPYLGVWIAAAMPAGLAFAVEPGWLKVALIFALYGGIDLVLYNFLEPKVYGSTTGLSPMAVLVAAVFWTWLWGPVGLLLATPLTVCVVVLGRYVSSLKFLTILLSDEPVLPPQTRFYQRLLAMDVNEATQIAEDFLKGKSLEDLYDALIIPALTLAEEDRHQGRLDEAREQFVFRTTRFLIEDLAARADELIGGNLTVRTRPELMGTKKKTLPDTEWAAVCIPARDEADEIAAEMLVQLLNKRGLPARALASAALAGESLQEIAKDKPRVACISVVPPMGYLHARYLCRRLRAEFPDLKLVAAILTERDVDEVKKRRPQLGVDDLASSLKQALAEILSLAPTAPRPADSPVPVLLS